MSAVDTKPSKDINQEAIVKAADNAATRIQEAREAISAVIYGQETVVERAMTTILSGGHGLLVGVPGLAKTLLVETMGRLGFGCWARSVHTRFDAFRYLRF